MQHRGRTLMAAAAVALAAGGARADSGHTPAPLTETQQRALGGAADDAIYDSTALTALIENARAWSPLSADFETQALATPDWELLTAADRLDAVRGKLYRIDGWFMGDMAEDHPKGAWQARADLSRVGGSQVRVWAVGIGKREVDGAMIAGRTVIVLFPRPAEPAMLPLRPGDDLMIPARLYKRWETRDTRGEPAEFLVFVAPYWSDFEGARVGGAKGGRGGGGLSWLNVQRGPWLIVVAVVVIAGAWFFLRRLIRSSTGPRPLTGRSLVEQRRRERITDDDDPDDADPDADEPLPDDPADALTELERRHAAADASVALGEATGDDAAEPAVTPDDPGVAGGAGDGPSQPK